MNLSSSPTDSPRHRKRRKAPYLDAPVSDLQPRDIESRGSGFPREVCECEEKKGRQPVLGVNWSQWPGRLLSKLDSTYLEKSPALVISRMAAGNGLTMGSDDGKGRGTPSFRASTRGSDNMLKVFCGVAVLLIM
jgi:hypothetical protein